MFCITTQNLESSQISDLLIQLTGPSLGLQNNIQRNGFLFPNLQGAQLEALIDYFETQSIQNTNITSSSIRVSPIPPSDSSTEALEESLRSFIVVIEELFRSEQFNFVAETGFCLIGLGDDLKNQVRPQLQALGATINILPDTVTLGNPSHRVSGYILFDNGTSATDLPIRLIHRGFGDNFQVLDGTRVNEDSSYTFNYTPQNSTTNIEIIAITQDDQYSVSLSQTIVNVGPDVKLNLIAPTKTTIKNEQGDDIEITLQEPLPNEFESLTTDLSQQMSSLDALAQAQETPEKPDLTILHQSTGWDARLIGLTAKAYQNTEKTGIEPQALYALYRNGLPFDTERLALVDPEVVDAALEKAQTAGITQLNDTQLETAKQNFQQFANNTRLDIKAPGTLSTVGQLLDQANLTDDERQKFADVYFAPRQEGSDFWQQVKAKGIAEDKISTLELQGKLSYLTLNNADLTASLQTEIDSLDKLSTLIEKDFHKPETWIKHIQSLAVKNGSDLNELIPPNYVGTTPQERLEAYAKDEARQVSLSFPTQLVGRMLNTNEITIAPSSTKFSPEKLKKAVTIFLNTAAPLGYELGRQPFDPFVDENRAALKAAIGLTDNEGDNDKFEAELDRVRQYHSLYQLTPTDNAFKGLVQTGFTSAHDVTAYTYQQFLDRVKGTDLNAAEANLVYRKAQQITAVTQNLLTITSQLDSTPLIHALSGSQENRETVKADLIRRFPGLNTLIGSLDYCECKHCRSVLSPAAYLVDLLEFINPKNDVWVYFKNQWTQRHSGTTYPHKKPFNVLTQRRPDIPYIELTCENTHTALPYIDVVNEIFEYYVANDQKLKPDTAKNTSDETTADLLAEPQHVIGQAYTDLSKAQYPLTLPFDLWLETVRHFFSHFKLPLAKVLKIFHTSNSPYDQFAIYAEQLSISPDEYAIFTQPNIQQWYRLYGYQRSTDALPALESQTMLPQITVEGRQIQSLQQKLQTLEQKVQKLEQPSLADGLPPVARSVSSDSDLPESNTLKGRTDLNSAKVLSQRLGVSYKELVELIKTEFINPHLKWSKTIDLTLDDTQEDLEKILYLADIDAGCSFENTILQYGDQDQADETVFFKLNLFVRLWKKLGWSISDCDRAIKTFTPSDLKTITSSDLGNVFKAVITGIAQLNILAEKLDLGSEHRQSLLTLFGNIPTHGDTSLYVQRFLRPNRTEENNIFAANQNGNYLTNPDAKIRDEKYQLALQGAIGLTASELADIFQDSNLNQDSILNLENISILYRYTFLAKALNLSIKDLISLKLLSGTDPFQLLAAQPDITQQEIPLIQFIKIAQQVHGTSFNLTDLNYLLRHKLDPASQPAPDTLATFSKTLIAEIKRIRTEYALPEDISTFTDDLIQQHLAMVMPPDVVDTFMALWTSAETEKVSESDLDQTKKVFFEKHLQKNTSGVGLFESEDFNILFPGNDSDQTVPSEERQRSLLAKRQRLAERLIPYLQEKLSRQAIIQLLATELDAEPETLEALLTDAELVTLQPNETKTLLASLIDTQLIGVNVSYYNSGNGSGDAIKQQLLYTIHTTSQYIQEQTPDQPPNSNSIKFEGALEVPTTGSYRFYATATNAGTQINLTFDHLSQGDQTQTGEIAVVPAPQSKDFIGVIATTDQEKQTFDQVIELEAGKTYGYELNIHGINSADFTLEVQSQTLPRGPLSRLTLYPENVLETIEDVYLLLSKAVQLISGFNLTTSEIRYFSKEIEDYGQLNLSHLSRKNIEDTTAQKLFDGFLRIARYHQLKQELNEDSDILVQQIFEEPSSDKGLQAFADIAGRELAIITSAVAHFKLLADSLAIHEQNLWKIWQVLKTVNQLGVSVDALIGWLDIINPTAQSNTRQEIVENLRNTLKARYDTDDWQRVAQAIFDPLRQKKRDALVAYILHDHPEKFERPEQLFEYFLIDPGMEPVVQTSRIKLALSSVQLFIQRCFLNLEPQVHPSALDSKHWQWMKRYRVWEANRKIFLYPENWLEPEFRDDKSHLFQELESALLQGDISNDLAEDAFFNYLKGLQDIARLELVTMYLEEAPLRPEENVLHLIGRTYNQPHKYFYRRLVHQTWTPWEPITANLQGDQIAAIVWQGRLHLFWVTVLEKAESSVKNASGKKTKLQDATVDDLQKDATANLQKYVEVSLNWCEYFQGKWTSSESGGFSNTLRVQVGKEFSKQKVSIFLEKEIEEGIEKAVYIYLRNSFDSSFGDKLFKFISKRTAPLLIDEREFLKQDDTPYDWLYSGSSDIGRFAPLNVYYRKPLQKKDSQGQDIEGEYVWTLYRSKILEKRNHFSLLVNSDPLAQHRSAQSSLVSPFFYISHPPLSQNDSGSGVDSDDIFFVEPILTETTLTRYSDFGRPVSKGSFRQPTVREIPSVIPQVKQTLRDSKLVNELEKSTFAKYKPKTLIDPVLSPGTAIDFGQGISVVMASGGIQTPRLSGQDVNIANDASLSTPLDTVDGSGLAFNIGERIELSDPLLEGLPGPVNP